MWFLRLFAGRPSSPLFKPGWKPEYDELAQYNREKARGLVHTPEWVARMKAIQEDYNLNYLAQITPDGSIAPIGPDSYIIKHS